MSTRRHQNPPSWLLTIILRLHAFLKERWQALVSKVQHTSGVAESPPHPVIFESCRLWQWKITIGHPEKPWSLKAQRNESLGLQAPIFWGLWPVSFNKLYGVLDGTFIVPNSCESSLEFVEYVHTDGEVRTLKYAVGAVLDIYCMCM